MSRLATTLAVLFVTLAGLALRWRGLDFALPHYTPSDELVIVDQVDHYRRGLPPPRLDGTVMPTYPLLLAQVVAPFRLAPRPDPARTAEEHRALASALRLDVRIVLMLVSLLAVPGTWWLARRLLSPPWALFAAALVATSFLSLSNSQMGRPHAPLAALSLLAVVAAMRLQRRGDPPAYFGAGLTAALAVGALHNGAAVLLPLAAAFALALRRPRRASPLWILLPLFLVAAAVRVFYPFHFESWTEATGPSSDLNVSGHLVWWGDFDGSGTLRLLATFYSYDPLILALGVPGVALALARWRRFRALPPERRGDLAVALAYAVPYGLVLCVYARTAERFVLPLLPFAALAAAYAASRLAAVLPRRPMVEWGTALVPLAFPAAVAWHVGTVRAAPDTRVEAAAWIRNHLDPDADRVFVLPYFTLPLQYGEESLAHNWAHSPKTEWIEYLVALPPGSLPGPRFEVFHPKKRGTEEDLADDPVGWMRSEGMTAAVVQHVRPRFKVKVIPETHRALREEARFEARFSPLRRDDGEPTRVDYNYSRPVLERPFFWHMLQMRCLGPTLEIYRLGPR